MITIYWHCLGMTEDDQRFVKSALHELAQHLKEEPIKLLISIKRLGDKPDIEKQVDAILNRLNDPSYTFSNCAGACANAIQCYFFKEGIFKEGVPPKLLLYCRPDSKLAMAAKKQARLPSWGVTCGSFSAVYKPQNKFIIWHETLHLLGLDECYDENNPDVRRPDCKCEDCIMQYEQPDTWVGPFSLCDKNIKLLKELAEKVG